jgi:amidohydrolase
VGNEHEEITGILEEVRDLRHDLHRHPELGFEEHRTAKRVLEFIGDAGGAEVRSGIADTGIVITFGKDLPGPCVALRADMDALAMEEASGKPWTSTIPGRMHACGHDGHTAMLAGAARLIARRVDELEGPVKLIFQPAEEGGGGGSRMVEAGVLEDPTVHAIYGLHTNLPDSRLKAGPILYTNGPAMAGTGSIDIEVHGAGGHAAMPHRCVDPIFVGASIVSELQRIVARGVDPVASAVISITQFKAGTTQNIIPPQATLRGTFRALDKALLEYLGGEITRVAQSVAAAHGARADVRCELGYPIVVNDTRAGDVFRKILEETGDASRLREVPPNLGGEDFAYFAEKVPGFFYLLPACPADREENPTCHDPAFDFNDDLLADGIHLHLQTALRFARHWEG